MSQDLAAWVAPDAIPPANARALLVFAHPDDETLALGNHLTLLGQGHLLHTTDGTPRNGQDSRHHGFATLDAYRSARAQELHDALCLARFPLDHCTSLGIPDQESARALPQLTAHLLSVLRDLRPDAIFTHPYEGGHPDHDACAFAVHTALRCLPSAAAKPLVIESTFYHQGTHGMVTGSFLTAPQPTPTVSYALGPRQEQQKRDLLACFRSQQETLRLFALTSESFRIAPVYNFRRPPHLGPVLYDSFPWGLSSPHFCELATAAERQLGLQP